MQSSLSQRALRTLMAILACATFLHSSLASAGDYYLSDVPLLQREHLVKFREAGLQTTSAVLGRTLTQDSRSALGDKVGLSEGAMLELAKLCELLQINGVGPKAAKLLQAGGIESVAALAKANPVALAKRLEKVNARQKITGKNPSSEIVSFWVEGAKAAKHHVK